MTQEHPITSPPELVKQWRLEHCPALPSFGIESSKSYSYVATQAARWGSDQELDECLQWFSEFYCMETWMKKDLEKFRAARRPRPPSLKEQALAVVKNAGICDHISPEHEAILIRALEQLSDD